MPISYTPSPPTLANDVLTINRFLNNPTMVQRRLRDLTDQGFIADRLLQGSWEASGGAIGYEVSESIYSDRDPAAVAPGSEYQGALIPTGVAQLALVTKYGQDVRITDEAIARQKIDAVNRAMRKSMNRTFNFVDTAALAAVASAVTQTQAAAAAWNTGTADPLLDVMLAQAQVADLQQGYSPNAVFLTNTLYARLVANSKVISGLRREASSVVTENGNVEMIGGLEVIPVVASRMPAGVSAFIADTTQLGGMGYENLSSPEYQGAPTGIQSWIRRDPNATDSWLLRTRRIFVPIVQEPNAAVKITGA